MLKPAAAMEDSKLQEIHDFLITIAHQAGEKILAARPTTNTSDTKKNAVDLVTETDKAVETYISTALNTKYPDIKFIGEETYVPGQMNLTSSPTFIVDPIDGTTNFVHAHPYVSISLGLAINYTPYVGVVYAPFSGLLYSGIRGHGAWLTTTFPGRPNEEPSSREKLPLRQPSPLTGVGGAQLCVEWGSDRSGNDMKVKIDTFARLVRAKEEGGAMAHSLRSFGSAALNLCGVAASSLDAYWEAGCWAWDVCAGWCILIEAGGCVVGANPGEWEAGLETRRYFAIRADGDAKEGETVKGVAEGQEVMKVSKGQKAFIEEFWGFVEGKFEVGG
ncbi:hypothetical protein BT63DRAFT_430616 [Microthyrium microscopicum]|uniref:Inositol-1-monophosphatase n=1 Tax=Microthyrium microscopicum TaxID=703497 RepID=A0A6A6TX06_9PEZI|nr:hypothetical protein BT63DRAFT_430616 [Microthyrium microscopicum]